MKTITTSKYSTFLFVFKHNYFVALIWGIIFGGIVAINAIGASSLNLLKVGASFANNTGLQALFGPGYQLDTVEGFVVWKCLGSISIISAIWASLTVTKLLRGNEESGRWDYFLAGQSSLLNVTRQTLLAMYLTLLLILLTTFVIIASVCNTHGLHFETYGTLIFALTLVSSAIEFLMIGAFYSQLFETRRQTLTYTLSTYAVFYLVRMIADSTNDAKWLLSINPLGWIEKIQPYTGNHIKWFLPIGILITIMAIITLKFAAKRDAGESIITGNKVVHSHLFLLSSSTAFMFRENGMRVLIWSSAIGVFSFVTGYFSKAAGQAFIDSLKLTSTIQDVTKASLANGATLYLGITYLLTMLLIILMGIGFINKTREDEAIGLMDNILVHKVGRVRLLAEKIVFIDTAIILMGLVTCFGTWIGCLVSNAGISFHVLFFAGINALAPAICLVGIGVFIYGILPRFTSLLLYSVIIWSFLIDLLGPAIKLNENLLNTSLFYHLALSPAVDPNWKIIIILILIGLVGSVLGVIIFAYRDIANE